MKHLSAIVLLIALTACGHVEAQETVQTPATQAWLQKNGWWFNDTKDPFRRKMREVVIELDNMLAKQGYKSDEEHYRRLDALRNLWIMNETPEVCDVRPSACQFTLKERQALFGPAY